MKQELLELLACPRCESELELRGEQVVDREIKTGELACRSCARVIRIRDFIPRVTETHDYAEAFTLEWHAFRTAHLDSITGLGYLDAQFRQFLDFPPEALAGKLILDAGCGLGRFSEVVLNYGGTVVAVDVSEAIDVAFQHLNARGNIYFLQADLFDLPLRSETFDFVYSWGVLHHTPDPPAAFRKLPPLVRPGGKMMTMVYANYNRSYLAVTEFYRKLTTKLPKRVLLRLCYVAVPLFYFGKLPVIGPLVTRILLPVSVRPPTHRWRVGNTFDLYSPRYAFTYDHVAVHGWYAEAGLEQIRPVAPNSGVSYVATKPPVGALNWGGSVESEVSMPEAAS